MDALTIKRNALLRQRTQPQNHPRYPNPYGPGNHLVRAPGSAGEEPRFHPTGGGPFQPLPGGGSGLPPVGHPHLVGQGPEFGHSGYTHQFIAQYNQKHAFDGALDLLRSKGLNQEQFDNLQAGHMPGHMRGMFLGMTPAQLKEVARYVNPQGSQVPGGPVDPITGKQQMLMHFSYNDPRAEGQPGATDTTTERAPWLRQFRPPSAFPVGPGGFGGHPPYMPFQPGGPMRPPIIGRPIVGRLPGGMMA